MDTPTDTRTPSLASRRWWAYVLAEVAHPVRSPLPPELRRDVLKTTTRLHHRDATVARGSPWAFRDTRGISGGRPDPWTRIFLHASIRQPHAPEAEPYLDALTSKVTAWASFRDIPWRWEAHGYRPSIYPTGSWPDLLAWAYDNYQAEAGVIARAFPEYTRHHHYGTYTVRAPGAWSNPPPPTEVNHGPRGLPRSRPPRRRVPNPS